MRRNKTDWTVAPGATLIDLLEERGLSQRAAARACGCPPHVINRVCKGVSPITAMLAVQLERAFGTPAEFWMNRQQHHDLHIERQKHEDTCYDPDESDELGPVEEQG